MALAPYQPKKIFRTHSALFPDSNIPVPAQFNHILLAAPPIASPQDQSGDARISPINEIEQETDATHDHNSDPKMNPARSTNSSRLAPSPQFGRQAPNPSDNCDKTNEPEEGQGKGQGQAQTHPHSHNSTSRPPSRTKYDVDASIRPTSVITNGLSTNPDTTGSADSKSSVGAQQSRQNDPQFTGRAADHPQVSQSSRSTSFTSRPVGGFFLPAESKLSSSARQENDYEHHLQRDLLLQERNSRQFPMASPRTSALSRQPSQWQQGDLDYGDHADSPRISTDNFFGSQSRQLPQSPQGVRSTYERAYPTTSGTQTRPSSPVDGEAYAMATINKMFGGNIADTARHHPRQVYSDEYHSQDADNYPAHSSSSGFNGYDIEQRGYNAHFEEPYHHGPSGGSGLGGRPPRGQIYRDSREFLDFQVDYDGAQDPAQDMSPPEYGQQEKTNGEYHPAADDEATKDEKEDENKPDTRFPIPHIIQDHTTLLLSINRESILQERVAHAKTFEQDATWKLATDALTSQKDTLKSAHIYFEMLHNGLKKLETVKENELKRKIALTERYGSAVSNLWDQCGDVQKATRNNAKKRRVNSE